MPTASLHAAPDRTITIASALGAVSLALFLLAPRASPACLALLLVAIVVAGSALRWPSPRQWPIPYLLLVGFGAWAAASVGWAADKPEAIAKSALFLALTLAVGCGQSTLTQLSTETSHPNALRAVGRAALIAFAASLMFLCLEELTGHAIKRAIFVLLPFTRPDSKHIAVDESEVFVYSYLTNRNIAAAMLAFWPMQLLARVLIEPTRRLRAMAALGMLALTTIAMSQHDTSIIAMAASSLVLVTAMKWPRLGLALLTGGWLTATLLVVPLATWASATAGLHSATWLPNSARHRIVLWAYTAEQVQLKPLHGVGAASTKLIDARRGPKVAPMTGTTYEWRSGTHAHNVFLQTWYELGAIAAMLLCGAGLALIRAISRLQPAVLPVAAAAMTTASVIGSFSWGLWQPWFLAAFAVSALLTLLAAHLADHLAAERAYAAPSASSPRLRVEPTSSPR